MQREEFNSLYYSIQSSASASAVVDVAAVGCLSRASVSLQLHQVTLF